MLQASGRILSQRVHHEHLSQLLCAGRTNSDKPCTLENFTYPLMPRTPPEFILNRRKVVTRSVRDGSKSKAVCVTEEEAEVLLQRMTRDQVRACMLCGHARTLCGKRSKCVFRSAEMTCTGNDVEANVLRFSKDVRVLILVAVYGKMVHKCACRFPAAGET